MTIIAEKYIWLIIQYALVRKEMFEDVKQL